MKPPFLRKIEKFLVACYFDDLITLNSAHSPSTFNPCQEIEYLWFVISSVKVTVSLTPAKEQKILWLCVKFLATEQTPIRQAAQLFGTFSISFIAVPYGKLYYKSIERCRAKSLVISKGNFDKIMHIFKETIQDILWWKHNIIGIFTPIVRENPSVIISTDASSFGWGHH